MFNDDLMCTICGRAGGRVLPDPGTLPADTVMCLACEASLCHVILGVPRKPRWQPTITADPEDLSPSPCQL